MAYPNLEIELLRVPHLCKVKFITEEFLKIEQDDEDRSH